eukprot:CAMPEP_0178989882 /NCGR_PEP_ID=MMETSP0795-20121207/4624_1 /TAXON_ID=88552 /ORGANISM="Amoebophrya sp., Strain Ameob2" /LENGTH=987 /DNA_ID=CAMNT_0020681339 /DNA_START=375 /DNA_END=3338 /DNA_ORIENTATION=+
MPPRRGKRHAKGGQGQEGPVDEPLIHPEVQKVLDFEAILAAEDRNEAALKVQKDKILQRCLDAFGHNLCGPDPVLNSTSLALQMEVWFIARELGYNIEEQPEWLCRIPNKLEEMHAERDNPLFAVPAEKLGTVTGIHFALRGAAKRLEKQHLWGTFTDLLRMTHRRDAELYRIVYFDLLKELVDDIVDEDDEDERKFLWMSCSPYPQDHRCPYAVRSMLEEDNWSELTDYSLKRKYFHIYRNELSLDTEDPDKGKNLFKLTPMAFVDVCVPEKWNHFHFLLPNEHYTNMAKKLMEEELRKKGKIDLTVKKPKNKADEKKWAKEKLEKEQMVAMFDSSDTDEDDFFEDRDMDPETRRTEQEREEMNNEVFLDLMRQDETVMESGLLGLSHQELPCYVLWNLCRALRISMIGLRPGGCLVLIWGTTPLHATFFWLKNLLQPFFDEINLLSSPFPSTESLIVCQGYAAKLSLVDPLCYFLTRPQRNLGVDDVLLWTFGDGYKSMEELYLRDKREVDDLLSDYKIKVEKMERYTIDMEKEKVLMEIERMKEEMREAERQAREAAGGDQEGGDAEGGKKKKKSPKKKKGEKEEAAGDGGKKKKGPGEVLDAKLGGAKRAKKGEVARALQEGRKRQRPRRKTVMGQGMKSAQLEKLVRFRNREPGDAVGAEVQNIFAQAMEDASPWNARSVRGGDDPTGMVQEVSLGAIDKLQENVLSSMRPEPLSPMRKREFNPYRAKLRKIIGRREDDAKQSLVFGGGRKNKSRRGGAGGGSSDDEDFGDLPDVSHAERSRPRAAGGAQGGSADHDAGEDGDLDDENGEEQSMIKMVKSTKKGNKKGDLSPEPSTVLPAGPSHSRWDRPWQQHGGRQNPVPQELRPDKRGSSRQRREVHLATSLGVGALDHVRGADLIAQFEEELNPESAMDKETMVIALRDQLNLLRDSGDVNVQHVYQAWERQFDAWREKKGLPPRKAMKRPESADVTDMLGAASTADT